ncbi:MAG: hypothetical protein JRG76_13985 [Deltaproteobacteria bacterium]|nr:hypothetical protein [Deltaproteobacteria bacterium]
MSGRPQALTLLALLLFGCGDPGGRAYREGRFRDAHEAFRSAGDDAPAARLFNRALAALRAGDLTEAETAAEAAAARGTPEIAALGDFLRGNAAFERCLMAERQASTAAAEPFAFDVALTYARKARGLWQLAAMSRSDWPEARRNVERALLKADELKRKKADREEQQRRKTDPRPKPRPPPAPDAVQDPAVEPQLEELDPDEVLRLLDKLAEKEKEKRALRRLHRKARMAEVERDW